MSLTEDGVRGLAPETQVGLSRYSVTIKLCDSYCLGIGLDELVVQQLSSCAMAVMMTPRSGVSVDDDEVDGVGDKVDGVGDKVDGVGDKVGGINTSVQCVD
ncbi:uncharacterized protein UHO2_00389 [Ustilago hordei]|uniref:uncharacterized protein n=1 Tax=Ustilago hordei TaxID=120017 RepID=UPI001A557818|nr:uncharacterized protein UHO2_00389 [Ustilago hordei]SYW81885.1 uncharacterized protein UHO2_00389 [Ustilago hordei]